MGFKMNYSREDISGKPPVPAGWYTLQFVKFKPKVAGENKDSVSLNAEFTIISPAEYDGRKVWATLNSKAGWILNDFIHSVGLRMEIIPDGNQGTEAEESTLPGVFENADKFPDDPLQWKYLGPITNKTLEAELAITSYQGRDRNEIRQYRCAVSGCNDKHSTNLIQNK